MLEKAGAIGILLGAVLILSALLLLFYNQEEDAAAGTQAESALADVRMALAERAALAAAPAPSPVPSDAVQDAAGAAGTPSPDPELPVVMVDGYDYIGQLSLPAIDIELPVMAEWDYARLKIAPCRQFGSSRTDDLVIAAHNYKTHFRKLSELQPGDSVFFTDMDGTENSYAVVETGVLAPNAVAAVQDSGFDLVLYTCTSGGATRVVVFCDRT